MYTDSCIRRTRILMRVRLFYYTYLARTCTDRFSSASHSSINFTFVLLALSHLRYLNNKLLFLSALFPLLVFFFKELYIIIYKWQKTHPTLYYYYIINILLLLYNILYNILLLYNLILLLLLFIFCL